MLDDVCAFQSHASPKHRHEHRYSFLNFVGAKILSEITKTLCKPEFVEKIMKPQNPISIPTFYELLSKIVNSSTMKLDKSSMEKLFYLILMTFKKQLFLCSSPLELFSLTKTHLEDLIRMQKGNPVAVASLQKSLEIFTKYAEHYSYLQYLEIREEILSMLESYKSRIVLFVEVGLQQENGQMIHFNRNSHARKDIGMGVNHQNIDFSIPNIAAPKKRLDYKEFRQWRSDLGKDDYDNIRGSSKFAKSKEQNHNTGHQRSISDFLKINDLQLDAYEVNLDIFGENSEKASTAPSYRKSQIKEQPVKMASEILKKIDKEFEGIEGKEEEGEIDLLDMMDGQ